MKKSLFTIHYSLLALNADTPVAKAKVGCFTLNTSKGGI